jgi:hypothetical protein
MKQHSLAHTSLMSYKVLCDKNNFFLVVVGMRCLNVVNMLVMTSKYVLECERFQLKLCDFKKKKLLLRQSKSGKGRHEYWVKTCRDFFAFKIEDLCENQLCI